MTTLIRARGHSPSPFRQPSRPSFARSLWSMKLVVAVYAIAILSPWVGLAVLNAQEIGTWIDTGMCPAGPMDRPAAPCGPARLCTIVFFGGWAAFIVVPVLVVWSAGCTAVLVASMTWLRRRSRMAVAPDDAR